MRLRADTSLVTVYWGGTQKSTKEERCVSNDPLCDVSSQQQVPWGRESTTQQIRTISNCPSGPFPHPDDMLPSFLFWNVLALFADDDDELHLVVGLTGSVSMENRDVEQLGTRGLGVLAAALGFGGELPLQRRRYTGLFRLLLHSLLYLLGNNDLVTKPSEGRVGFAVSSQERRGGGKSHSEDGLKTRGNRNARGEVGNYSPAWKS